MMTKTKIVFSSYFRLGSDALLLVVRWTFSIFTPPGRRLRRRANTHRRDSESVPVVPTRVVGAEHRGVLDSAAPVAENKHDDFPTVINKISFS